MEVVMLLLFIPLLPVLGIYYEANIIGGEEIYEPNERRICIINIFFSKHFQYTCIVTMTPETI